MDDLYVTEDEFDFVIVGAGVAGKTTFIHPIILNIGHKINQNTPLGCVLASRISTRHPDHRILLLEAGAEKDDRVLPAMGFAGGYNSDIE